MWRAVIIVLALVLILATRRQNTVGIVSMMKDPPNIDTWLEIHRKLGVKEFWIRLEDTPHLEQWLSSQPDVNVEVGKSDGTDEYTNIQNRQKRFVDDCLKKASTDWLIHIDSDEILDGLDMNFGSDVKTLVIPNKEAVYSEPGKSCFNAKRFKDCTNESCAAYGNGKGAGRVSDDVSSYDPHRFQSKSGKEDKAKFNVLHYEGCDFDEYKKKFKGLTKGNKSDIPFQYYKDAIDAAGDDAKLEEVYKKHRCES